MDQKKKLKEGKGEGILYQGKQSVSSKEGTSGITLVALVVTIVVLLILAGITIMYVMGDNGVFGKAKNAKDQTERATFEERLNLAMQDAVMERAINGGLLPTEYFDILKKHGIISDVTVPGGNISSPTENTDGSKTYEITSDDDYIFEAIIYPDGKVETEVIGKDGNIEAKIRSILVTNKTKTSIDIRVLARLQGGTVKAYYKKASEVTAGEAEDNIAEYEEIKLTNLTGKAQNLEAGQEYKIKAILEKDGKVVSSKSINAKTGVAVSSITLNKPEATIGVGKDLTLEAQVLPDEAEEKGITWSTSDSSVVAVDQNGKITGVKVGGPVTITATSKDVTTVKATCSVTVEEVESDWAKIAEVAKLVAEGNGTEKYDENGTALTTPKTVTKDSMTATVTIDGKEETIKVGDTFKVKVGNELREVIVLGFNHDELVTKYDGTANNAENVNDRQKTGISFQFKDFMTDSGYAMNSNGINNNGWGGNPVGTNASEMRTYLEGEGIGLLSTTLQGAIKQVKKDYLLGNQSTEVKQSNDKLWLLSCSEIFSGPTGSNAGGYGLAKAKEGERYKYYAEKNPSATSSNDILIKKTGKDGSGSRRLLVASFSVLQLWQ